jgi:hypothetical protein
MFTPGFIVTPLPILAPNIRNNLTFIEETGLSELMKNSELTKNQSVRLTNPAPSSNQLLSYFERSVLFITYV